jgi:hypothetical protein
MDRLTNQHLSKGASISFGQDRIALGEQADEETIIMEETAIKLGIELSTADAEYPSFCLKDERLPLTLTRVLSCSFCMTAIWTAGQ